jgi:hypothetical protein
MQDSPSLVKLLLILVEIFGPAPLFLKSSEISEDKSYVEPYLSLFNADFVPWCLDGKYSTCSSKIDLLLSLIQEECFFDQWCLIIKHIRAEQRRSVDYKTSNVNDQFELLTLILQKVRERIGGGKLKNLQRSGSLPEHWRHDLLDSVAVSVFCDLPATDTHVNFLWYVLLTLSALSCVFLFAHTSSGLVVSSNFLFKVQVRDEGLLAKSYTSSFRLANS